MASLVAILSYRGDPTPGSTGRMIAAAPHRGPLSDSLVHGRVSIGISATEDTDSSLAESGDLVAAFAGVLDNITDLQKDLAQGSAPGSISPAELMISAFRKYGDGFPDHLRGIFVGVVATQDRMWCFRDHLGLATLFYRDAPEAFYIASEVKQIVAGAGITRRPNFEAIERIFYGTQDDDTPTAVMGVLRLPKASVLRVSEGGHSKTRYWNPEALIETWRPGPGELQERFDDLFTQAVGRMFLGRDSLSLSGGLDSAAIAGYGAPEHLRLFGRPLEAISAVYPNTPSADESDHIRAVCARDNIPLHTYEPQAKHLEDLDGWMDVLDGPIPHASVTESAEHYRRARALGFATVFTGEIAEAVLDLRRFLLPHLLLHGRFRALSSHVREAHAAGEKTSVIARRLGSSFVPGPLASRYLRGKRWWIPTWIDRTRLNGETLAESPARSRWIDEQLSILPGPGLGMEADHITQAVCGVRTRKPWGDVDVWELFLSLPAEVKMPSIRRKEIERQLLRGHIPDQIIDRTGKTYFNDAYAKSIDMTELSRWVDQDHDYRVPGVDYEVVKTQLRTGALDLSSVRWVTELASVHAFLSRC